MQKLSALRFYCGLEDAIGLNPGLLNSLHYKLAAMALTTRLNLIFIQYIVKLNHFLVDIHSSHEEKTRKLQ